MRSLAFRYSATNTSTWVVDADATIVGASLISDVETAIASVSSDLGQNYLFYSSPTLVNGELNEQIITSVRAGRNAGILKIPISKDQRIRISISAAGSVILYLDDPIST